MAAARRIAARVRHTPLLAPGPVLEGGGLPSGLRLKLESLQVTGSFKARGASNKVLSLPPDQVARGLITASGGNHGIAVAYAGHVAGSPTTVYLPGRASAAKAAAVERWGATVVRAGDVWDDAHAAATAAARREGLTYLHPFDDPDVIAGQGTIALEILADAPATDLLVVAIGGGGLISGIAAAARAIDPAMRIVGVEPTGAPKLTASLRAGALVTLDEIHTAALTLAPRRSAELNLGLIREHVEEIVLVTDEEMLAAARWLWRELGVAAELSGAAAVAALLFGRVPLRGARQPCAVVCGAGRDGMD